jgi:two-component system, chemotaxis family, chemotaxis protein CheY
LSGVSPESAVKHCLVVDDSRVIRKVACNILATFDIAAEEAETAEEALQCCRVSMPDMILFDSQLPGTHGLELLRSIRREPDGKRPVIVVCTTENDVDHITEALAAGANEYIMKPFDREILEAKLAQVGLI